MNLEEDDIGGLLLLALAAKKLKTPYLASGGIGDGRGLAAAITLGADGVNCGTLFMATQESYIHQNIKDEMVNASGEILTPITSPLLYNLLTLPFCLPENDTTHIFRTLKNTARVFKNKVSFFLTLYLLLNRGES